MGTVIRSIAMAATAAIAFAASDAAAFERQQHLGAGAGLALAVPQETSGAVPGGAFAAHYAYGLTDAFNLLLEGGGAVLGKGGPRFVGDAGVGIAYAFDVVEWVPYVGVVGEGFLLGGGTKARAEGAFGGALALGIDWQTSRSFAIGLAARQHVVATRFAEVPSFTTVLLRAELLWGW